MLFEKESEITLKTILEKLPTLNLAKESEEVLRMSEDGIRIAKALKNYGVAAHLMSQKAACITEQICKTVYHRQNLIIVPEWFAFSLESDQNKYNQMTSQLEKNRQEVLNLFSDGYQIATENSEKLAEANVLLTWGGFYAYQHSSYRLEHKKKRLSFLYRLIRDTVLSKLLLYSKHDRSTLRSYSSLCKEKSLAAASIYHVLGEEQHEAQAYFNLSCSLTLMGEFSNASEYLKRAEPIANKLNDNALIAKIEQMKVTIKTKDKVDEDKLDGPFGRFYQTRKYFK